MLRSFYIGQDLRALQQLNARIKEGCRDHAPLSALITRSPCGPLVPFEIGYIGVLLSRTLSEWSGSKGGVKFTLRRFYAAQVLRAFQQLNDRVKGECRTDAPLSASSTRSPVVPRFRLKPSCVTFTHPFRMERDQRGCKLYAAWILRCVGFTRPSTTTNGRYGRTLQFLHLDAICYLKKRPRSSLACLFCMFFDKPHQF